MTPETIDPPSFSQVYLVEVADTERRGELWQKSIYALERAFRFLWFPWEGHNEISPS